MNKKPLLNLCGMVRNLFNRQVIGSYFAQDVSKRDKHTLDEDVKMYFLSEAAAMDAFIACWDTKMTYDFARPYTLFIIILKTKK